MNISHLLEDRLTPTIVSGLALLASAQEQEARGAYDKGIVLCTELNALTNLDGALEDLNNLVLNYPQAKTSATLVINT